MNHSACLLALAQFAPVSSAKDKKKDPEEIGSRDVGKGINFYSLEREIALGKQLAQEVERQAKIVEDPVIGEYVNRVARTWSATPTRKFLSPSRLSIPRK
jgi:predicted Zn-dependent protease